jgi:nucleoside-triphosphate--adenylate kinase
LIRKHVHDGTDFGKKAKEFTEKGALVPDDMVVQVLSKAIEEEKKKKMSIILDGFPRNAHQAKALEDGKVHIDMVINVDVPHQTIMERMCNRWIHFPSGRTYSYDYNPPKKDGVDDVTGEPLAQREDDKPEVVKARLDLYEKQTLPLLQYYKTVKNCKVTTFHGTESDKIYPEVKKYLQENL